MQGNETDGKVTLEEAKITLGDLVSQASYAGRRFVITRYGKPAALLVPLSPADLDRLEQSA